MENQKGFKISQYACAVLLIVSSTVMVAYQVVHISWSPFTTPRHYVLLGYYK